MRVMWIWGRPAIAKRQGGLYRLGLGLGTFAMADRNRGFRFIRSFYMSISMQ